MYNHIRGQLILKEPSRAVVEAGGVGYLFTISFSTYEKLPALSAEILLYTHLQVREDSLRLYGFQSETERDFFNLLLSASGVGPAIALNLLACGSLAELQQAILKEDVVFLSQIKGIGKKMAQKISLELRDKVGKIQISLSPSTSSKSTPTPHFQDAVLGLIALGYPEEIAQRAIQQAYRDLQGKATTEELVTKGLLYVR